MDHLPPRRKMVALVSFAMVLLSLASRPQASDTDAYLPYDSDLTIAHCIILYDKTIVVMNHNNAVLEKIGRHDGQAFEACPRRNAR